MTNDEQSATHKWHGHYRVYGVTICSNHSMPELPVDSEDSVDSTYRVVTSTQGVTDTLDDEAQLTYRTTNLGIDLEVSESSEWYHLRWPEACEFHISRDGSKVMAVVMNPRIEASWLNSLFYGVVLSYVLHARGNINLHAGAVVAGQSVLGLLAEAGTGKSTLTAHLAATGLPFVTDDIIAPVAVESGYAVPSGFPYVSLTAESIESVFGASSVPDGMSRGTPDVKERVHVDGDWATFQEQPASLGNLVVLARGDAGYSLRRLEKHEAVLALVQHSVALPLLPKELIGRHMAAAAKIVEAIPVSRLEVPRGLEHMGETVELLRREYA